MTEEESKLFDQWYDENYDEWAEGEEGIALREELEQAYLAGLHEGQPKWHKYPDEEPDEGTYLVVWKNEKGYKEILIMNYEEDDEEELHWIDGDYECHDDYIIAWCEIPQFKE